MTRLEKILAETKAAGKKGLFIYLTAGTPDRKGTIDAIRRAEEAGANVIELGLPFSDPLADGPVIQAASVMALKGGMKLKTALEMVEEVRKFSSVPLIGMGYINNMLHYGLESFVDDAKSAGMDGLIIPDLPHEESETMRELCKRQEIHLAEFITPGTTPERMKETCASASGFIYCVSNNGVTGVKKVDYGQIGKVIQQARTYTEVPLAVGFGIGSPEAAKDAARHADAVIVGSAVVKQVMEGNTKEAMDLVAAMREALDAKDA